METNEMLKRLATSDNETTAIQCKAILSRGITIEEARKYAGGFLYEVLSGNYLTAVSLADTYNLKALTNKETDDENLSYSAFGHEIANKLDWNGRSISQTFLAALTDANFHDLKIELEQVIDDYFKTY